MPITINVFGTMCDSFNLIFPNLKKRSSTQTLESLFEEMNGLLVSARYDKSFVSNHILNKIVQITGSEYGFLGEVMDNNYLHIQAITHLAWNASSYEFFQQYIQSELVFPHTDTIIGESIHTQKVKIVNKPSFQHLPKGHPLITKFLGIPCSIGDKVVVYVGLCNKHKKYTKKDIRRIQPILYVLAYLFVQLHDDNTNVLTK